MANRREDTSSPTIVEDETITALCPHCDQRLSTIKTRQVRTTGSVTAGFGKRYVYACPACHKLLGITHRKGFWMG